MGDLGIQKFCIGANRGFQLVDRGHLLQDSVIAHRSIGIEASPVFFGTQLHSSKLDALNLPPIIIAQRDPTDFTTSEMNSQY